MNSGGPNKHTWTPRRDPYKDIEMDIEADFLSPAVQPRKDFVNEFLHLWRKRLVSSVKKGLLCHFH